MPPAIAKATLVVFGIVTCHGILFACIPPSNTSCTRASNIGLTCDQFGNPAPQLFHTQCSPASSWMPEATNAPVNALADDEVWFHFLPPRTNTDANSPDISEITITVYGNTAMMPVIELYSILCPDYSIRNTAEQVATSAGKRTTVMSVELIACEDYYFRVYHEGAGPAGDGDFRLMIASKRPENDDCSRPFALTLGRPVYSTMLNASESKVSKEYRSLSLGYLSGGSYDEDVWFSFSAWRSSCKIEVALSDSCSTANFDPMFDLWDSDPCNTASAAVKCVNSSASATESWTFDCLDVGRIYFIRVANFHPRSAISPGSGFIVTVEGKDCIPDPNDEFCKAYILNRGWQGYKNDGIEFGNSAGIAPNVTSAYFSAGPGNPPRISCATLQASELENVLKSGANSGANQSLWYRFYSPENCDADVTIHTNDIGTDVNTIIAVYETKPGYVDDPRSTFPLNASCSTDLGTYILPHPIAVSDDWPAEGPVVTSAVSQLITGNYHRSYPAGHSNSYLELTTGSGEGKIRIKPATFYFVQVDAIPAPGQYCTAGNFNLFYQVDLNEVPQVRNFEASNCGITGFDGQTFEADIIWDCNANPPDEFIIRGRPTKNPATEPLIIDGISTYGISPANPIAEPAAGKQRVHLNCLPCGEEFEVWVFYHNEFWNGNDIKGNYLTSHMTYSNRFQTPHCPPAIRKANIEADPKQPGYVVFPNPNSTNFLNIAYNYPDERSIDVKISVVTLFGGKILEYSERLDKKKSGILSVPAGYIGGGIYLLTIEDGTESKTERLIIDR